MNQKNELDWLKKNKEYLSIDKIEKEVGCPFTTIQQFVSGNRNLPDKWHGPVIEWVRKFKRKR
jgi:hypothetical protein